jgi:hypothetical protein
VNEWENQVDRASSEVSTRAIAMRGRLPMLSETVPASSMPKARAAVEIESGRLAMAGETPNSLAKSGKSGCTS